MCGIVRSGARWANSHPKSGASANSATFAFQQVGPVAPRRGNGADKVIHIVLPALALALSGGGSGGDQDEDDPPAHDHDGGLSLGDAGHDGDSDDGEHN